MAERGGDGEDGDRRGVQQRVLGREAAHEGEHGDADHVAPEHDQEGAMARRPQVVRQRPALREQGADAVPQHGPQSDHERDIDAVPA